MYETWNRNWERVYLGLVRLVPSIGSQVLEQRLEMVVKIAMKAIPGFVYDEIRQRYFRCPANHLASLPLYQYIPVAPAIPPPLQVTNERPGSVHCFFSIIKWREYAMSAQQDLFQCHKLYCSSLLHNLKKVYMTETDFRFPFGYQFTDSVINSTGDLLVFSCAKEVHNTDNPVCYKRACVFKVVTTADDKGFQLEEVNVPLGVMRASSLQPHRCVKVMSSGGCHKVVLHSDRLVEMAKLESDFQDVRVIPLKRIPKGAITAVALNPVETNYSLAVGFESGRIELLKENSSSSDLLCGRNNPILSLAFSEQKPLLHAGHRNGCIAVWDLRRQTNVISMQEANVRGVSSSVVGIHPLLDDNYLICSSFNSKLSLWDLRLQKAVTNFSEHVNDYKYCKSVVDKAESFLTSVGSDACIRIWILHTGELVRCIEPQEYGVRGSCSTLPTICYSETFGGQQFNPSLLVGINKQLVQFSTHNLS